MAEVQIGVREAAELLRVTRQMVHKLIKSKQLSASPLSVGGALILNRGEVVAFPARQVMALAEKIAGGSRREVRLMADLTAILNRMPAEDVRNLAKKLRIFANREQNQLAGSVAGGYGPVAEFLEDFTP